MKNKKSKYTDSFANEAFNTGISPDEPLPKPVEKNEEVENDTPRTGDFNLSSYDERYGDEAITTEEELEDDGLKKYIGPAIKLISFLFIIFLLWSFRNPIADLFQGARPKTVISELKENSYSKKTDYEYVKLTDDFYIKNYQHLLDAYYTILDSGVDNFTIQCDKTYKNCLDELEELANNKVTLSNINSFVSPFNSFSSLETKFDNFGKIEVFINKAYSKGQITSLEEEMKKIIAEVTDPSKGHRKNLLAIHDYIISKTKYDTDKSQTGQSEFDSSIAIGPLLQGRALCGGYTDAMALFLDYYNIPNYKVISENHIWNAVYLEGKWLHLDLTWDDPVMSDGSDVVEHTFFLISHKELMEIQKDQHFYDAKIFSEVSK